MSEKKIEELKPEGGEQTPDSPKAPGEETKAPEPEVRADELKDTGKGEPDIDYKAELDKARADTRNYREGLLAAKDKIRALEQQGKQKRIKDEVDEEELQDKASQMVRAELDRFKSGLVEDQIDKTVAALTNNLDERELTRFHYENSIVKSGYSAQEIENDMRKANLLANEAKFRKNFDEITEAAKAKQSTDNKAAPASEAPGIEDDGQEINLNPEEQAILQRRGLTAKDVKTN